MKLAVISVTIKGAALAQKLKDSLTGDITLYAKAGRDTGKELTYKALGELVSEIFSKYEGLIFIMAAGIVVRVIAPYVQDKRFDPAVVVIDDGGVHTISLLSGHLGGANELTHLAAKAIGAQPVVTTATDVAEKTAPDVLARKLGLALEPFSSLKTVNAALANGEATAYYLDTSMPEATSIFEEAAKFKLTLNDIVEFADKKSQHEAAVFITDKVLTADMPHIYLRPKTLTIGVGCRRGTSEDLIFTAIEAALKKSGLSSRSVKTLASIAIKQDEEGLLAAGRALGAELKFFSQEELQACIERYKLSVSKFVNDKIGVGNVCEAAALLSAPQNHLVLSKTKYQAVTIAIAAARSR